MDRWREGGGSPALGVGHSEEFLGFVFLPLHNSMCIMSALDRKIKTNQITIARCVFLKLFIALDVSCRYC